jgi:pimeloyl-ACP methyl ester carboxylesterase
VNEFSSNGVKIAFSDHPPERQDRRAPILLIHGFASSLAINWRYTHWIKALTEDGRRVIALDNRGHGFSQKLYQPNDYTLESMAGDAVNLLDHLGIGRADIMGYSMGARIAITIALNHPERLNRLILGGVGRHLLKDPGLPNGLAEAMEADSVENISSTMLQIFRRFAQTTGGDLRALAACARGFRTAMDPKRFVEINAPVLICVGTKDDVAGDPHIFEPLFNNIRIVDIPDRDHNRTVGDRLYRQAVLDFLAEPP